jgi:hypothetical protein
VRCRSKAFLQDRSIPAAPDESRTVLQHVTGTANEPIDTGKLPRGERQRGAQRNRRGRDGQDVADDVAILPSAFAEGLMREIIARGRGC